MSAQPSPPPDPRVPLKPERRVSLGERLSRAVAALAWIGFGWAWVSIFARPAGSVSRVGVVLLAVYAVFMLIATLGWRRYNQRLHAQLGPRTRVPRVRESWRTDFEGRVLRADWAAVRRARMIRIDVTDGVKSFHVDDGIRR